MGGMDSLGVSGVSNKTQCVSMQVVTYLQSLAAEFKLFDSATLDCACASCGRSGEVSALIVFFCSTLTYKFQREHVHFTDPPDGGL